MFSTGELHEEEMSDREMWLRSGGKTGRIITATVAVGFLLVLGYGFLNQPRVKGGSAPDFTLSLFGGGEVSLAKLRGQVVVVNFWASWCQPCREEAPALEKVWREYQRWSTPPNEGITFVGIDINDIPGKGRAFIEKLGITYPNGPDPYSRISKAYHVTGVPETFFITRDGQVTEWHIGPITEAELRTVLEELLQR